MKKHILVAEDDIYVADGLRDILTGHDYLVTVADSKNNILEKIQAGGIDLLLLDVRLGADDGYALCKQVRRISDLPVLFLTACSSELELIRGFQAGGDDYLTKPFRMQELLVRIQALLRRSNRHKSRIQRSGDIVCNRDTQQIQRAGQLLNLSATERRLTLALLDAYPRTLTRQEILSLVWDMDGDFVEMNTLNVNISRLREKLGTFDGEKYIQTVRGVGYCWSVPVTE